MTKSHPNWLLLVLLSFVAFSTSGCLYSREIAQTRRDIERQYPDLHLEREVVMNFGPGMMGFARWVTGLVRDDDAQLASRMLEDVRRLKVGVYRLEGGSTLDLTAYDLPRLRRFDGKGWETAARIHEDEEVVWVMYRERRGRIENLFVAVLDNENLVLTRLDGDLEKVLQVLLEEKGHLWHD